MSSVNGDTVPSEENFSHQFAFTIYKFNLHFSELVNDDDTT